LQSGIWVALPVVFRYRNIELQDLPPFISTVPVAKLADAARGADAFHFLNQPCLLLMPCADEFKGIRLLTAISNIFFAKTVFGSVHHCNSVWILRLP